MKRCAVLLLPFALGTLLAQDDTTSKAKAPAAKESAPADKVPPRKSAVPSTSEGVDSLAGQWVLENDNLGKSVAQSLQKAAGKDAKFEIEGIKGDYLTTIDLAGKKIVVEWKDWQLAGVSRSARTGNSKLVVKVTGRQEYEIASLTEGEKPSQRRWILKPGKDAVRSTLTFRGFETKSRIDLPTLANGLWTVHKNQLFLQGRGEVWTFARGKP